MDTPEAPLRSPAPLRSRPPGGAAPRELRVGGLTPFSTIDYPGKLSAVVFVQGCPWRCGYCHNPHLQPRAGGAGPAWPALRAWLARRVGLIDAVVFSGGEPTVDPALPRAIAEVRVLGLQAGLHSAGTHPRRLREVLPMLDWIGLDVKAPPGRPRLHARVTGVPGSAGPARESLRAVLESGIAHELRTTAHPALLADEDLLALAEALAAQGVRRYALQVFRPVGCTSEALTAVARDYPQAATLARLRDLFPDFVLRRD